jgi:hypothetical protein
LEDIVFDDVRLEVGKTGAVRGGFYDDRPIGSASAGGKFAGLYTSTIAGIHADFTRGLELRDTAVTWGVKEDFYGAALESRHAEGIELENFSGESAQSGKIPNQILK